MSETDVSAGPDVRDVPVAESPLAAFRAHFAEGPAPGMPDARRPVPRPSLPSDWRDSVSIWLGGLRDDPRARAVAVGVVLLVAGLIWYRAGLSGAGAPPPPEGGLDPSTTVTAAAASTGDGSGDAAPDGADGAGGAAGGPVYVHVAGAVRAPGLYRLRDGARVADALRSAGGAVPDADVDRLNLAALLQDGQQVYVPTVGEAVPAGLGTSAPGSASTGSGTAPATGPSGGLVNLNTATAADLEALPGIGPVIAEAIVSEREQGGPYATVDDLLRVSGIGEARLEELRPHVSV